MALPHQPPASRTGRDRDVLPAAPAPGPYERPYEVVRGYQPAEPRPARPGAGGGVGPGIQPAR